MSSQYHIPSKVFICTNGQCFAHLFLPFLKEPRYLSPFLLAYRSFSTNTSDCDNFTDNFLLLYAL